MYMEMHTESMVIFSCSYNVINYPITEYSFMEERLKLMDDFGLMVPPSTGYSEAGTSPNPSAAPSIRGESPSRLEGKCWLLNRVLYPSVLERYIYLFV